MSTAILPPRQITSGAELQRTVRALQQDGQTVGLVPTMGALHEGHLSLVDAARAECDTVVVTIFVNPTQFSPQEDLEQYPRDLPADLEMLRQRNCDLVFVPTVAEMYPDGFETYVDVGAVARPLEGETRPQHFRGVATVVLKLFMLAPADRAYFGQKDYQQSLVVRQMVRDLHVPIAIRVCPIVREPDGVAMSSRNAYLSAAERRQARVLSECLQLAQRLAAAGERRVEPIRQQLQQLASAVGVQFEYVAFLTEGTITPVERIEGPVVVALAARIGQTRLIDNAVIG